MGASTPHRKSVRMWPNSSCSICLVSALMWIGRVVVLQPESSNHAPIHGTISPPILPCVHIAEDLWAPPLELWARPPVLTPVPCRRTHSSQRLLTTTSIPEYRCPAHPSISGACFAPRHEHYCLSGPWCLAFRDCRQSKDTQHKVHRHQQNHLRTCHCHWHKPKKDTTSPLKFKPHMDRQCLIVCDLLTLVLDAPTYSC